MAHWKNLEEQVRRIASVKWTRPCEPRHIAGVDVDGVCEIEPDRWAIIEISTDGSLDKYRTDLAKFSTVRPYLMSQGIYPDCYFVTDANPTQSVEESARSQQIKYFTLAGFESKMLGGESYKIKRIEKRFGSATRSGSSRPDDSPYVPIGYTDGVSMWDIDGIASGLRKGEKFVLLGEFGTGKSRAVMEIFSKLAADPTPWAPIAIDLRDSWGARSMNQMVRTHLEEQGLENIGDAFISSISYGYTPVLLDGFDEIAGQSWSNDLDALVQNRAEATRAIRDLVEKGGKAGILITGREHYFSSNSEMLKALGVAGDVHVLRCPDEFSPTQAREYISALGHEVEVPDWLPRKPLMCQIMSSFSEQELRGLVESANGEVDFFRRSLTAVCAREASSAIYYDPEVVEQILIRLALRSRANGAGLEGGLQPDLIHAEFKDVTGEFPTHQSMGMLQRLPYLGRTEEGQSTRAFVDDYIRDGLVGIGYTQMMDYQIDFPDAVHIKGYLGEIGGRILTSHAEMSRCLRFGRDQLRREHVQVAADIVGAVLENSVGTCNLAGMDLSGATFGRLNLAGSDVENWTLSNVFIHELVVEGDTATRCHLNEGAVVRVYGASVREELPAWLQSLTVEEFDDGLNTSSISRLPESDAHKTLLSIVQKLFFQRGSGRMERALMRGADRFWRRDVADMVVKYMLTNDLIYESAGRDGSVFRPNRSEMQRMSRLKSGRRSSGDELWDLVGSMA